jgi:hypothetical protein
MSLRGIFLASFCSLLLCSTMAMVQLCHATTSRLDSQALATALPGDELSRDAARNLRGGQVEVIHGDCTDLQPCTGQGITCNLVEGEAKCENTQDACGSCSGAKNEVCSPSPESPYLCATNLPPLKCCVINKMCRERRGADGHLACNCVEISAGIGTSVGTRNPC